MPIAISRLVKLALWNIGAFVVGIAGASLFDNLAFLAFGVGAVGLITFFGMLETDVPGVDDAPDGNIRRTVAATLVAVYAVFVASLAFFDIESPAQGVVRNFTTLTAVVVAFYLCSSAYLDARRPGGGSRRAPRKAVAPRRRPAN